jgi:hypothetical protein
MPTKREREYYRMGFSDGLRIGRGGDVQFGLDDDVRPTAHRVITERLKPKRKLSSWNKFVKANSKKPRFRMRSGKLNLRKMGVAFRKTPAGRKKKGNRSY